MFFSNGKASSRCAAPSTALLLLLAGCVHQPAPAPDLAPADNAATLSARSLQDPGLQDFLRQNLGRAPVVWDFESLSWVAFYYQPSLAIARAHWAAARAELATAAARPNPVLGLVPGYSSNAPAGVSPWFPSVNLDFLLETDRKRDTRSAAAKFAAEASRLDLAATVWEVRGELHQSLIDLAAAERRAALLHTQSSLQQQLAGLLQRRLEAGAAATPEVAAARQAALRAEAAATDAERQLPAARNRVAAALGVPLAALEGISFPAPEAAPKFSPEALGTARRLALQNRADVLGALARYESARSALQLEISGRYPDVHLGPGFQWDQGQDKWSIGLSFELPVFNRHEGPIAAARARLDEAAAQLSAVQARVIAAIDGAAAAHTAAVGQAALLRRLQESLDQQLAMARTRLQAGSADRSEYLNAGLEAATGALTLAETDMAVARTAGQLEDALQVPFANLETVAPPAGPPTPPSSP